MPQPFTKEDWVEIAKQVVQHPRLGVFLLGAAVKNTLESGWNAPRRWYGLLQGKPYWRYLRRK